MLENIDRNVNRYPPLWYPRSRAVVTKPRFVLDPTGALRPVPQPFSTRLELCKAVLDGSVLERVRADEYWFDQPAPGLARFSAIGRLLLSGQTKVARQAAPDQALYGSGHLNAAGNAIVTRELTAWLKAQLQ